MSGRSPRRADRADATLLRQVGVVSGLRPDGNVLLGALAAATSMVSLESVVGAIRQRFGGPSPSRPVSEPRMTTFTTLVGPPQGVVAWW